MTCPVLKISQHCYEDYGSCLAYADFLIHQRRPAGFPTMRFSILQHHLGAVAMELLEDHADAFNRLRKGL